MRLHKLAASPRSFGPLIAWCLAAALAAVLSGCIQHRVKSEPIEVKPIKVEPIHITVDVNVRVQERLERFFAFEEEVELESQPQPQPQPR